MRIKSTICLTLGLLLAASATGGAEPPAQLDLDDDTVVEAGRARFERNCGICHGLDGKGDGPFSELLKVTPPDLTVLSKRNYGYFPFSDIYNAIDGRNLPLAHGTRQMPIWGERYKKLVPDGSETQIRGRILEVMIYLYALQEP